MLVIIITQRLTSNRIARYTGGNIHIKKNRIYLQNCPLQIGFITIRPQGSRLSKLEEQTFVDIISVSNNEP